MIINSKFPRDVLNELKYRGYSLGKVTIYYINRGSPNDTAIINGSRIWAIESFLKLYNKPFENYIPYHRILKIEYDNEVVFDRSKYGIQNKT